MKLGTLKSLHWGDGELVVVSKDNSLFVRVPQIAPSLRLALENWGMAKEKLSLVYSDLNAGKLSNAEPVKVEAFHSPLPRTFQWADGSAFLHHVKLVRMARNAEMPESLYKVPLMYQGGGDNFLSPTEDIPQVDFGHGTDFEGEVGVITDFVPMGATPEECLSKINLFVVINDVSLRGLIPEELVNGFGFFHGKPSSSFAPFAVTADELGEGWKDGRVHLPLNVEYNGQFFGKANGGAMHFHFGDLISHAAKTRHLMAGTIIGSGTISNEDPSMGSSCIAEKRMIEKINEGTIKTPFMKVGDTVKMEMLDTKGRNIFGTIFQKVAQYTKSAH
ncbi:MAG: fumarylacetoacetate hydrolase family protein [Bdellovibrionaceae bacterium]|nr:fumarylacetoacetate hydrolase family protein [Pseudobdellovibrionaceae bacterium]